MSTNTPAWREEGRTRERERKGGGEEGRESWRGKERERKGEREGNIIGRGQKFAGPLATRRVRSGEPSF